MKKIITLIAVALAMTMSINAADTFINGVKYSVSFLGDFAMVSGYNEDLPAAVVIEDKVTIDGTEYNVEHIATNIFSGNESITSVKLPTGLKYFDSYAFENCTNLETVTNLPTSNLEDMGDRVFNGTKWIKSLEGDGVYLFGGWAIAYLGENTPETLTMPSDTYGICYGFLRAHGGSYDEWKLETLVLNEGLKRIECNAFEYCSGLTEINIPSTVKLIAGDAFESCDGLTSFNVAEGNTAFSSIDGVLFDDDKYELRLYPTGKTAESYTVPAGIKDIMGYAFYGAGNLKQLIIPEGVSRVYAQAIREMGNLETIDFPSTLTELNAGTFYGCKKLKTIIIRATEVPNYGGTDLSSSDFDNTVLYVPEESLEAYKADTKFGALNANGRDNIKSIGVLTGIDNIASEDAIEVARYDITGRQLKSAAKGINIVKYSDGSIKKVLVK